MRGCRQTKRHRCCVLLLLVFLVTVFFGGGEHSSLYIFGQRMGFHFYRNFSSGLHTQNWAVIQDRRGVIYVANQGSILEYDGVSRRKIDIPNRTARSLAVDDSGIVYVGGTSEIGYLAVTPGGTARYVSLLPYLSPEYGSFLDVWKTHATDDGIYFQASRFIFLWEPQSKRMSVYKPEKRFYFSFYCNGMLWVRQKGLGLTRMEDRELKPVPGGEVFKTKSIYMMASYPHFPGSPGKERVLIGTRSHGFFHYDGNTVVPFPTQADEFLGKNLLYHGVRLSASSTSPGSGKPGSEFVLATLRGGVAVMDAAGKLKQVLNKRSGLQDDNVKYVYEDYQGNLWLALEKGITKVEYASPLSHYDANLSNLEGIVLSMVRHGARGDLYVGTTRGLYCLESPGGNGSSGRFRPVALASAVRSLLSNGDSLFAAASNGVFRVTGEGAAAKPVINLPSRLLRQSRFDPRRIWISTRRGIDSLIRQNESWLTEHTYTNTDLQIESIAEDADGNLWLGTRTSGVVYLRLTGAEPAAARFNEAHGLPPGEIHVFFAAGHVMFATEKGIFRFHNEHNRFLPDPVLGTEFADGELNVFRIREDKNKNVWIHAGFRNFQAIPLPDGSYALNDVSFLRMPQAQVNMIYPDTTGDAVWFGGSRGLSCYDPLKRKNYHHDYPVLIREILVNGSPIEARMEGTDTLLPIFPYRERNIGFGFAAPFFEAESETRYRCFLEGYDREWGDWGRQSRKNFTNLNSGTYTLHLQAINVYKHLSRRTSFSFRVLPPWYKAWWAFLLYAGGLSLAVYFLVNWRSRKLAREKQRLETIVQQRTGEVHAKNLLLEEQSQKLKELDRVKSRFFANISHEFRTPLTLIMGPLEKLRANCYKKEEQDRIDVMLRNSRRLLDLINRLLELSRFESGKVKLNAACQDIVPFAKGVTASFDVLAHQKGIQLEFVAEHPIIELYFDGEKMEEVLYNLLMNAVKFTPPDGEIQVSIKKPGSEFIELSVRDTGTGIPGEKLPYIFERFYQAQDSASKEGERNRSRTGTGIGLALTKELVNLHHGKIDVHSSTGSNSGTELVIRLPKGKDHLEPGEIAEKVLPSQGPKLKPPALPELNGSETDGAGHQYGEPDREQAPGKNVILVVDDSAEMRTYIRDALEPVYLVEEAVDGNIGVAKARKIIPDLIVSDIMMPAPDGYDLCRIIKKDVATSHIPVILLTAKAGEESMARGLETGADDYITKPFSTRLLTLRIKNLIAMRSQLQSMVQRQMMLQPAEVSVSSVDEKFIKEVQQVIETNISEQLFNVDQLGKKLYMSRATLYRKIQALTGQSPRDFIRSYRLKRGAELIKSGFGNITEVALEVGFSSTAYFSKCFKEKFQRLPSDFQADHSRKDTNRE